MTPFAYQSRTNKVFSTLAETQLIRSSLLSARKKLNSHQWSKKSQTTTNNYWSRTHRTATSITYSRWTSRPLFPDLPWLPTCQRKRRACNKCGKNSCHNWAQRSPGFIHRLTSPKTRDFSIGASVALKFMSKCKRPPTEKSKKLTFSQLTGVSKS